jgi:hypothetical protein
MNPLERAERIFKRKQTITVSDLGNMPDADSEFVAEVLKARGCEIRRRAKRGATTRFYLTGPVWDGTIVGACLGNRASKLWLETNKQLLYPGDIERMRTKAWIAASRVWGSRVTVSERPHRIKVRLERPIVERDLRRQVFDLFDAWKHLQKHMRHYCVW